MVYDQSGKILVDTRTNNDNNFINTYTHLLDDNHKPAQTIKINNNIHIHEGYLNGLSLLEVDAKIITEDKFWGTIRYILSRKNLEVQIEQSKQLLRSHLLQNLLVSVSFVILLLTITIIIGTISLRNVVLIPIAKLLNCVRSISSGAANISIKLKNSPPELTELSNAIILMNDTISERNRSLHELNAHLSQAHDKLEQRVKERTAELFLTTEKLKKSNQELEQFAYIASHDLQEPLRKIRAFSDRLQSRCGAALDSEGLDYMQRMINASTRMQTLINELLHYSRLTTKARPFQPVALSSLIKEVLEDLEVRIEENHAHIEVHDLPTIIADPLQIRQLFQNLISNALKFQRPQVEPLIIIKNIHNENDTDFYNIEVKDNGIGFEMKYTERIFGLFQRLHGRSAYEGTGMGLAICRKIVERHEGTITATSEPGFGTTFLIRFPSQQFTAIENQEQKEVQNGEYNDSNG
ncbi:MAG: hypothetical protein JW841_06095 [Deltaproteobacteria bacterium]|nr:hypothetical protein [Deltaproteobacteria bacterium]